MKKKESAAPNATFGVRDYQIPAGVDRDLVAISNVLVRIGRLNELFISSINAKVLDFMKPGYGEPWVLYRLTIEGPPFRSSPTALCRGSLLTSGGMTKTLGKLEDAGLVARIYDANDRRALLVELTERGQELGVELVRQVAAGYAEIFGKDVLKHYDALREILTRLEQLTGHVDTRGNL